MVKRTSILSALGMSVKLRSLFGAGEARVLVALYQSKERRS
jgi:hypothetical protein